jgi:hypothetical protein
LVSFCNSFPAPYKYLVWECPSGVNKVTFLNIIVLFLATQKLVSCMASALQSTEHVRLKSKF